MTTANFDDFNSELNKRLATQIAKMLNAQFKNFQLPYSPAIEAMQKQLSEMAPINQINDRIREITAASMPPMPKINIKMPQLGYLDDFSKRYGRMIFDMTEVGRRFNLEAVQSVVKGVEDGTVVVDEATALDQNPELTAALDSDWQDLTLEADSMSEVQRRILRQSLIVLNLALMTCVIYIATGSLVSDLPEFPKWFSAVLGSYGLKGIPESAVRWAGHDEHEAGRD